MNLFYFFVKKLPQKYKLSVITVVLFIQATAQELPPIVAFSPKEYGGENQNWAISQGKDKRIYVANNAGLLRFNGEQWELFPSVNQTIIRSVKVNNERIYTGCYKEFGYWKETATGQLVYTSLTKKLKIQLVEDEQFWRIITQGKSIVFQSLNRLYIYDEVTEKVKIISANSMITKVFAVGQEIFFQVLGKGIYTLIEGKSVLFSSLSPLTNEVVVEMMRSKQGDYLYVTQQAGIWVGNGKQIVPWASQSIPYLKNTSIYSAIQLENGDIVVGTISNGIYHLTETGQRKISLNQSNGLVNNTVLSMFEDVDKNIWLGLDNGISVVNVDAPFRVYHDLRGRIGTVYAAQEKDGYLYIGSNQGLFCKKKNSTEDFQLIPGTNGQVWCLKIMDNTLFCGHNAGTFLIQNNQAQLISNQAGTWDLKAFQGRRDWILQGNYSGLSVLHKENNRWKFHHTLTGLPTISCRYFEWISARELVVNHEYKGVFKVKLAEDGVSVIHLELMKSAPIGLKSGLATYQNKVYYFSDKGVFEYNSKRGFVLNEAFTKGILEGDVFRSGKLIHDPAASKLWGFTNQNIVSISPNAFQKGVVFQKIALPVGVRNDIAGFESILPLGNTSLLFGTTDGYIITKTQQITENTISVVLQSITKGNRTSPKAWVNKSEFGYFSTEERQVAFQFYVPSFSKYEAVLYSYKLDGLYEDWTDWSSQAEVNFDNLLPGDYIFSVRAKQNNQLSENIASYSFTIAHPWYATSWAKIMYGILGVALLFTVNRLSRKYYIEEQNKEIEKNKREFERKQLESEQKVMQLQNLQLVNEIESKNRELTLSTMSIIKKNEILHEIKRELAQLANQKEAGKVIRVIDENLNDTKDWEFLEEAFNHADKDFLRKLKTTHPELTPNDLRFCAYLRLNLSSKEIAPLLNISVRSVEIKRYRIRKKMDLPHEKSLVDYILSL